MPPLAAYSPSPPQEPPSVPQCPYCGGSLVPLRGQFRCLRCSFALCEGCETQPNDDE